MAVATKKQLGQFFTVRSDYIFQGLEKFVEGKSVTDPFAGDRDLMVWAKANGAKEVIGYDVDPRCVDNESVFSNDSLLNPKPYKFVVTNPPYLNINKADKKTKDKYFKNSEFEDLYQISLDAIMNSEEGIVIVPLNFLSAINSRRIRRKFFERFKIDKMNYFRHQVFPDTTYNVIAFHYLRKSPSATSFAIDAVAYQEKELLKIKLSKEFDWTVGGDLQQKIKSQPNTLGIHRLTEKMMEDDNPKTEQVLAAVGHYKYLEPKVISKRAKRLVDSNVILLRAIDSGTDKGRIGLDNIRERYDPLECLISKETSRNMIHLIFKRPLTIKQQNELIGLFNREFNKIRETHASLILTNYRDNDRKRVSFDFVYKFLNYLYFERMKSKV